MMRTPFDLIQALRSWFHAKDAAIFTGGLDIDTGGGDVVVGAGTVDGIDVGAHAGSVNAHHNELHTVASHSDTTATGSELETLTNGSDAGSLHIHDARYYRESEFSDDQSGGAGVAPLKTDSSGNLTLTNIITSADARVGDGLSVGGNVAANSGNIMIKESSTPGTPSPGWGVIWLDTSGDLHFKNDAGTDTNLTP